MKRCPHCSKTNSDEAIYCQFCGKEIGTKPVLVNKLPEPLAKKKKPPILFFLIIAIIGCYFIYIGLSGFVGLVRTNSRGSSETNTDLLFDVPSLLQMNRKQIEASYGRSIEDKTFFGDELSNMPEGGISAVYQSGKYKFWIFYDSSEEARGFQIIEGLESDKYSMTDWRTITSKINVPVSGSPYFETSVLKKWVDYEDYDVMVSAMTSNEPRYIWTVQVLETK